MDVIDFSEALCHLNTTIDKYHKVKKAYELISQDCGPLGREIINTIREVLSEKITEYEEEVIELATKLIEASNAKNPSEN